MIARLDGKLIVKDKPSSWLNKVLCTPKIQNRLFMLMILEFCGYIFASFSAGDQPHQEEVQHEDGGRHDSCRGEDEVGRRTIFARGAEGWNSVGARGEWYSGAQNNSHNTHTHETIICPIQLFSCFLYCLHFFVALLSFPHKVALCITSLVCSAATLRSILRRRAVPTKFLTIENI